ncbi:MAG: hypothetical protein LBE16_05075, partial [Clostridiales Family XIII bacterium]|nr:hypothetical protein [Clostridiales Family XIII bacterium]
MRDDSQKEIRILLAGKARGRRASAGLRFAGLLVALLVFYALSLPVLTADDDSAGESQTPTPGAISAALPTSGSAIDAAEPTSGSAIDAAEPMFAPMSFDLYGYSSDLADFLTAFQIKDKDGNVRVDGDCVRVGEDYTIEFTFMETSHAKQLKYDDDGYLTYQLPEAILIPAPGTGGEIKMNGAGIGTYEISSNAPSDPDNPGDPTNALIKVRFDATYSGQNYIDYYGNAEFSFTFEAQFVAVGGGDKIIFNFGNNLEITITVDDRPYITVTKDAKVYDPQTSTISYTVTVMAHNGTVKNIMLTDDMGIRSWTYGIPLPATEALKIVGSAVSVTWTEGPSLERTKTVAAEWVKWETTQEGYSYGSTYTIKLGDDVVLQGGEQATVKYIVHVAKEFLQVPSGNNSIGGSHSNTVTVTGTDADGMDIDSDEASKYGEFGNSVLIKGGIDYNNYNGNNSGYHVNGIVEKGDAILWSIQAGDGRTSDMAGAVITDTIGAGQFFPETSGSLTIWLCRGPDRDKATEYVWG